MDEDSSKEQETNEGLSEYAILMALLSQGISEEKLNAKWRFYLLFHAKRIHNLLATAISVATIYLVYCLVNFVMDNSHNFNYIFNRTGSLALAFFVVYTVNKKVKGSKVK